MYSFTHKGLKITLVPTREGGETSLGESKPKLLSLARFEKELKDAEVVYALICKEVVQSVRVAEEVAHIVEEFIDVFTEEFPTGYHPYERSNTKSTLSLEPPSRIDHITG